MYAPPFFREENNGVIGDLIRHHPFATIVSGTSDQLRATHLPLVYVEHKNLLFGHFARGNRHWRDAAENGRVLCIFQGPDAYVSPHSYSVEPDVPTWNYVAVHVHGRLSLVEDPEEVRRLLTETVDHFEAGRPDPWRLQSLAEELVRGLERGIVAFHIAIDRILAASKLSQDKCTADAMGVIAGLSAGDDPKAREIAARMSCLSYKPTPD